MAAYYQMTPYSDELYHYGVKGMKWGVRKAQNYISNARSSARRLAGNMRNEGALKGAYKWHAQNVSKRLHSFDDTRKGRMSNRQMQSYEASKKYWDKKAAGKTNRELKESGDYRGIIKRTYDSHRSRSLQMRTAIYGYKCVNNVLKNNKAANKQLEMLGQDRRIGPGQTAATAALSTALTVGLDELQAKLFGHY